MTSIGILEADNLAKLRSKQKQAASGKKQAIFRACMLTAIQLELETNMRMCYCTAWKPVAQGLSADRPRLQLIVDSADEKLEAQVPLLYQSR